MALFEQMEQSDANLRSVAETRRNALTGLEWRVISAAEVQRKAVDKTLADEAQAYCEEVLDEIDNFPETMEHLATAIGCNLAAAEIEWVGRAPVALHPIGAQRLIVEPSRSPDVRIITEQESRGFVPPPGTFIVHTPYATVDGTPPIAKSLCRSQAIVWLIKTLMLADWASFCALFGQPRRRPRRYAIRPTR